MKRILVINAGQSQKNYVFQRLSELDYEIIVLNPYILDDIKTLVDAWILSDLNDIKTCLEKIEVEHRENPFHGILTFWEEDVLLTAEAAKKFGLPGINVDLVKNIRNKYQFRKLCETKNIITPKFLSLEDSSDIEYIEKNMTFPCVVKPVYGACSAFVKKCYSAEDAFTYYTNTKNSQEFKKETELGNVKDLFLESYIGGQEVDIDILVQDSKISYIGISDNFDIQGGFFVEAGQECPSHLENFTENTLRKQAQEIIEKIGISDGCLHFEAKVENDTIIPLELNLRMGGDEVWYFNREVYGVDLIESAVKIACGEKIENSMGKKPQCHVHGEYFLPTQAGIIQKINIDTPRLSELGVIKYEMRKKVGDRVNIPPHDFGFLGWYIVKKEIMPGVDYYENDTLIKKCFQIEIS